MRRPRNITLHPKFSVQGTPEREYDIDSNIVLCDSKSAHFLRPLEFVLGPPLEVLLTHILGGHLAKILTNNHYLFFKIISKQPLSLTARFFTHFLSNNYYYSLPHLLLKDFTCIIQSHLFLFSLCLIEKWYNFACSFIPFFHFFLPRVYCNGRLLTRWGVLSISRTRLELEFTLDDLFSTPISACFSSNACFKFRLVWC